MEGGSFLGFLLVLCISLLVKSDAEQRGMDGNNWAAGTFLFCLIVLPVYMLARFPKEKSSYNKKQLIAGNIVFFIGLVFLCILLYHQLFISYHLGEFDLLDTNLVGLVSFVSVYIFAFLAL